jgi:hypothetical protein
MGGPGAPGFGGPGLRFKAGTGGALDAAASALGLKLDDLLTRLRGGKSIAAVAKDQGKSLADVKTAITAGVTKELDQAVSDKKLTSARRDEILTELGDHLDDLVNGARPAGAPRFDRRGQSAGVHPHRRP